MRVFPYAWPICPAISLTLRNRETGPASSRAIDSFQLRDSVTFERIGPRFLDTPIEREHRFESALPRVADASVDRPREIVRFEIVRKKKKNNTIPSLLILRPVASTDRFFSPYSAFLSIYIQDATRNAR